MHWEVIEQFVEGRSDERACEDLIVVTDHHAAVVDGATDESGIVFAGRSGGRFAAEVIESEIRQLPNDADARLFVDRLTAALELAVTKAVGDMPDGMRWPAASVVCLSAAAGEVWRVGDCHVMIDRVQHLGSKRVDQASYGFRAAINAALLVAGTSSREVADNDPGRQAARPLLDLQQHLANTPGPWGYGCVNGRAVPNQFVEVFRLPKNPCEVVLTSDGYIEVLPSLEQSEARLSDMIATDQAAVGDLWVAGKSVRAGSNSFDDRAYLRIAAAGFPAAGSSP